MSVLKSVSGNLLYSTALVAVTTLFSTHALADTVQLTADDSGMDLSGELIDFTGDIYVLRTNIGDLRIRAEGVQCEGEGCPSAQATTDLVSLRGASDIGLELMPLLIEGYANMEDAGVDFVDRPSGREVVASLAAQGGFGDELGRYLIHSSATIDAFTALRYETAQIGMASRRITPPEARSLRDAGAGLMVAPSQEHVFALESLVVVVHPDNPVHTLTMDQVKGIFTGRYQNWQQVGGPDAPITVIDREGWSAKRASFAEAIFGDPTEMKGLRNALVVKTEIEAGDGVAGDVSAIGYVSHANKRGNRALELISDCGLTMSPDGFAARTEEYALLQRLYLYNREKGLDQPSQAFLDYVLSGDADPIIRKAGFFDLSVEVSSQDKGTERHRRLSDTKVGLYERAFVDDMLDTMEQYDRLSTTFRFQTGSAQVDERGRVDMERLLPFLETVPAGAELLFVGFTDDVGTFDANRSLSLERANAVLDEVRAFAGNALDGFDMQATGFGEIAPAQCNSSAHGRSVNRRVEVWLKSADELARAN